MLVEEPGPNCQSLSAIPNAPNSPGIESTHVMITFHAAVHYSSITLFSNAFTGNIGVDPVRKAPHGGVYLSKLHRGAGIVLYGVLEMIGEVSIVQKDVGIMEPAVEVSLDRFDGLYHPVQLLVPGEHNKRSIRSLTVRLGLKAPIDKDLVILFTYPPTIVCQRILDPLKRREMGHCT